MKQRLIWTTAFLMGLLLVLVSSCAPAATSNPKVQPNASTSGIETAAPTENMTPIQTQRQRATGTLSKIDGSILTLTTGQGPVTVKVISDNTTVQKITTGSLSDLKVGISIIATGPQNPDGSIAATSITIRSQGQDASATTPEGSTPVNPSSPRTGSRRGASGTLTNVQGQVLTVTTGQGPVTVKFLSDNVTVQKSTTGTLTDLRVGQALSVSGSQDAGGIVTARTIYISP